MVYELDQEYAAYDWEITEHTGTKVSGGDLYNTYGVSWDVVAPALVPVSATVEVTVTDENGCLSDPPASATIDVGDDTPPTLTLPADVSVNNIPGSCQGSVILRIYEGEDAGDNYYDDCGNVETVEYQTRWRYDDETDWGTVAWGGYTQSSNASDSYDVGETQVQWRITDYSGNVTTGTNTITVSDNENPGFTTSPLLFTFDAGVGCDYTHDKAGSGVDMSLTGDDNCEIERIWVTFEGDATEYDVNLVTPNDPTDGYYFSDSETDVTWHIEDKAGNTNTYTYTVQLEDITDPVFDFVDASEPTDAGDYNFEGSFDPGQRFYIFADNEDETYNLSIPATITDNCSMGEVTVTLTHNNGTQTVTGPFVIEDIDDGTEDDIFTFNADFALGQTTVRWDYNDATGNHPKSVTHNIVVASHFGFGSVCPAGTVEAHHECNMQAEDFGGDATPVLPDWFSWLRTYNILTFIASQSAVLGDPDGPECLVSRDRDITLTYDIQIQGSPTMQLRATSQCTQVFEYFIDNEGPVVNETPTDLTLECTDGADHSAAITTWLGNYAGIDIDNDITDNCHTEGFTIDNDYTSLSGQTCGAGSITTVTFTVTDGCDQTSTYQADIIVDDTTDPYFTDAGGTPVTIADLLPDITVDCHAIPTPAEIGTDVFAADDCIPDPDITYTSSNNRNADGESGTCDDNAYTIFRTWTVTDACGNSIFHTREITVEDNDQPEWNENVNTLAPSVTVDCNNIPAAQVFTYNENCDINPTYSYSQVSTRVLDPADPAYYNYSITRTWSAQDNCNAANEHIQVITVEDVTAPTIDTEASPLTVECDGEGNLTQLNNWLNSHGGAVASDPCVSPLQFIWTNDYDAGGWTTDCGNAKEQEVTFTVTDPAGNSDNTSAIFTIEDTQAPEWSGTLVYSQGPYNQIADLPAAYATVAEIEAAGVTVTDDCSPGDAGLIVEFDQDETVGTGCSYTVERTYTITDACGNENSTLTQDFIVLDGIDPEIVKDLSTPTYCAENTADQNIAITGMALIATDITDNCNTGQWFIDNAASGAIRYRVYHTTNNTHSIPWTVGNPDEFTFWEGVSEVYYRVTDQNNNDVEKHIYTVTVEHTPHLSDNITVGATDEGFTGGADQPLQYSTHDYFITMENAANLSNGNAYWEIYDQGDRTTPYTEGVDYSLTVNNAGTDVTATVTFDGTLAAENTFDLVFTEIHAVSSCPNERSYTFTLNGPFDVDIDDEIDICPDTDTDILEVGIGVQPDGTGTTTTVSYAINLVSDFYENDWSFDYAITIAENGGGGNDASVNSVTFTSNGLGMTAPATETGTVTVEYNAGTPTTIITLEVEYNDIHGTTQLVEVALSNITGQSTEVDENTQLGTENDDTVGDDASSDQNNVLHLIKNLPIPGNIDGMD
ncbi:MAG: hypothetical protein K9H26_01520 [Prolixibacteraceae bacterium]|nr:hypothetical protein [Prolixibacteraceae bacterium]